MIVDDYDGDDEDADDDDHHIPAQAGQPNRASASLMTSKLEQEA